MMKIKLLIISMICALVLAGCGKLEVIEPEDSPNIIDSGVEDSGDSDSDEGDSTGTETNDSDNGEDEMNAEDDSNDTEQDTEGNENQDEFDEPITAEDGFVTSFGKDDDYDLDVDISVLSDTGYGWNFNRVEGPTQPTSNEKFDMSLYDAYYLNHTDEKVLYLTFDEGYENGYTASILDTLKEYNVKATFFITGHYIDTEPELVQRMVDEGHIVANHSVHHPKFSTLTVEEIEEEIVGLNDQFKELTGENLAPFFRPPSGDYSEKSLYVTRVLGYRTIFWSLAFADWDPENQPGKEGSYNHVMTYHHPGSIMLLHAVSESNAEALPDILNDLLEEGYRFGSLYEFTE